MKKTGIIRELFGRNALLYAMTVPGIVALFVFSYLPMAGIVAAFQDFNIIDGFFKSKFVGFYNFRQFFTGVGGERALNALSNTLVLNTFFIMTGLVVQLSVALAIKEIGNKVFKTITQSVLFLPYFLSWIVIGSIIYSLFSSDYGTVNVLLKDLGLPAVRWYAEPAWWKPILVVANIWKWTGYGSIIYLAAIASFDGAIFEAAIVDGAGRFQQLWHITLPMLKPTAVVLVLFSIGRIFYGDLVMIYGITQQNGVLQKTTEVIDTYVYRSMRDMGNFAQATAIGVLQSLLGLVMITLSNRVTKRFNDGEAVF
jgi:putative aldouronate transport system permease protein